ncbi:MAG: hypothetical protein IKO20_00955 [Bacteroidaceae bacterium]|nr:hypothetical protein [Bacteroidaceae bacterium]
MKKFISFAAFALMLAATTFTLTACGDDDDAPGVSGTPSPTISDAVGNKFQLYSAPHGIWFEYDDNGKLTSFSDGDETWTVKGNTFILEASQDETESYHMELSLNGSGLISYATCVWSDYADSDPSSYEKGSSTFEFTYNGSKQCIASKQTYSCEGSDDEVESAKWSGTETMSYSWENGNMVKAVLNAQQDWQEIEDGKRSSGRDYERSTYEFTYSDTRNPLLQMPYALADILPLDDKMAFDALSMLGLFGVGPAYLPSKRTNTYEEWEQGDNEHYTGGPYSNTFSYVLNDNGTIYRDNYGSYSYSALEASKIAAKVSQAGKAFRAKARNHYRRHKAHTTK